MRTYEKIWELALPFLKKGIRKDFILHTKGVVKAMRLILKEEKGDFDILIPAAILHDTGWSKVPHILQKSNKKEEKIKALKLHIKYAPEIIEEILTKLDYDKKNITKVKEIVIAHKFQDPKEKEKQLLIDADTLADSFKKQFYADVKAYGTTPEENYNFRIKNRFYTKTAEKIFEKEMEKRKSEF